MAFEELKAQHSVVWGAGPYQRISDGLIDAHEHLISINEPEAGERWLDVATGTGNFALRAAARGATVTAQDITPELIAAATERASTAGLEIDFCTGDCEDMPFPDGEFDTVSSTFGHMFSPDHVASANELARVCRPGGRIALLTWSPTGSVAQLFAILSKYQKTPPPSGTGHPFDWGDTEHVNDLLGDYFNIDYARGTSVHREASGEALWHIFREDYGPTKVLADSLDDETRTELAQDYIELFDTFRTPTGEVEVSREYLLTIGTRTDLPVGEKTLTGTRA